MPTPILLEDTAGSVTLFLQLEDGAAATGLTFSDVVCAYRKNGAGSFTNKTLDGTNFTELSNGFYEIDFTSSELDTSGNFYIRVTGTTILTGFTVVYVATSAPSASNPTTGPDITVIYGWVFDGAGDPFVDAAVSARPLADPTVLYNGTEGLGVSSSLVTVKTDSDGYFTLALITGASVEIFIPSVNYRRTIVVPVSSTNLFDIP